MRLVVAVCDYVERMFVPITVVLAVCLGLVGYVVVSGAPESREPAGHGPGTVAAAPRLPAPRDEQAAPLMPLAPPSGERSSSVDPWVSGAAARSVTVPASGLTDTERRALDLVSGGTRFSSDGSPVRPPLSPAEAVDRAIEEMGPDPAVPGSGAGGSGDGSGGGSGGGSGDGSGGTGSQPPDDQPSDPSEPTPSEPAPSDPAPSDPAPSDPAPSEPTPSEPAPSEPVEPAPSDPVEPAPSDPVPSDPLPSDPTDVLPSAPVPSDPTGVLPDSLLP